MIAVVDLERIKVNVSVKDEFMDAGLATIILGAQNPHIPGFGPMKDQVRELHGVTRSYTELRGVTRSDTE